MRAEGDPGDPGPYVRLWRDGGHGRSAEQELFDIARDYGSRLIGPNCVGIFSAAARVTWTPQADLVPGGVSFISQSGGLADDLLAGGRFHGLAFDKIASIGNCADLDIADYLRFLRNERSTTVVGLYVEGPRDGRDMFDELAALAAVKPVLVLKGGRSGGASPSVTSHTGRIAGSYRVWQAAIRQAGAVEVRSFAEMVTGLAACRCCRRSRGDGSRLWATEAGPPSSRPTAAPNTAWRSQRRAPPPGRGSLRCSMPSKAVFPVVEPWLSCRSTGCSAATAGCWPP